MSKAKQIGTAAETAVKNYLLSLGYTAMEAHRNVLKGSEDEGDVWLRESTRGLIVFEVKGGKAAKTASHEQIKKWMLEAEVERKHADANYGVLVTQRAGVGYPRAGEWWVYTTLKDLVKYKMRLDAVDAEQIVRLTLKEYMEIVRG
jgi:hypothetical protein